jgi:hypothetical protein
VKARRSVESARASSSPHAHTETCGVCMQALAAAP